MQKQTCLNCHFLTQYFCLDNNENEYIHTVNKYQRDQILAKNFLWQNNEFTNKAYKLKCYMFIWDEMRDNFSENEKLKEILTKKRNEKCFFLQYNEHLGLPRAENLRKHTPDKLEKFQHRLVMIIGIVIAIIILLIDILVNMFS
ncbi:MAG: hypothetical protein GY830_09325 [Bacteroidetes bacterium]|nr:hypothetical protein [Bacteroidota bacterium]